MLNIPNEYMRSKPTDLSAQYAKHASTSSSSNPNYQQLVSQAFWVELLLNLIHFTSKSKQLIYSFLKHIPIRIINSTGTCIISINYSSKTQNLLRRSLSKKRQGTCLWPSDSAFINSNYCKAFDVFSLPNNAQEASSQVSACSMLSVPLLTCHRQKGRFSHQMALNHRHTVRTVACKRPIHYRQRHHIFTLSYFEYPFHSCQ